MKKISLIPLALIATLGAAWAATIIFPNTTEFARVPQGAGTIGGALYGLFNPVDGSAHNSEKLAGKYASGYLQDRDCSGEPINKVWAGVDSTGRGICGHITTPLASIGKFTGLTAGVQLRHADNSVVTPAIGTTLVPGDVVVTNGGTATITFTDDLSILRLDTNTTVALSTGENTSGQSVAQAILSDGRLWGRILTSTGVNLGGGGMVAGVRGTSVSVEEEAGTTYIAIPHSTQGGGAAHITCGGVTDDMGPEEIIDTNSSCQSHRETYGGDGTVGFYNNSEWVRSNTLLDIAYLRSVADTNTLAQNELMVTLPQSDERDPLCIGALPGGENGAWFPSGYGCQPKGILAMADYTLAGSTGIMITPTSEYTKSMFNSCQNGPTDPNMTSCTLPLELRCNSTEDAVVDHYGRCQWPRIATGIDIGAISTVGSPNGWKYDCDARPEFVGTAVPYGANADGIFGGANLSITCAKQPITNLGTPINTTAGGAGISIIGSNHIEYNYDKLNSAVGGLAYKKVAITVENLPTVSGKTVADFGSIGRVKVTSAGNYSCTWTTDTSCATANPDNKTITFHAPPSSSAFVIGNNITFISGVGVYGTALGVTIKKIQISN